MSKQICCIFERVECKIEQSVSKKQSKLSKFLKKLIKFEMKTMREMNLVSGTLINLAIDPRVTETNFENPEKPKVIKSQPLL